ncbi:MAG: hypothetical protein O7G88_04160 [bacterium]|nr:hypothetical protein [bacterium]
MRTPLQNRVDPFGEIHSVPARGTVMGNRGGCLHDNQRQLGRRRWASKRWIACRLAFKGRHRTVMTPGRYTELFFLDEATALAAGHRPCFECRRQDANAFADAWARAFELVGPPRADAIDIHLHAERMVSQGNTEPARRINPADLPNYAMIAQQTADGDQAAWLVLDGTLRRWTFEGYGEVLPMANVGETELITAASLVAVLAAGYPTGVHRSAAP